MRTVGDNAAVDRTPGKQLAQLRVSKSLSQKELAFRLGHKNNSTVSVWENDRAVPGPESIAKIAVALGIDESELGFWDRLPQHRKTGAERMPDEPRPTSSLEQAVLADARAVLEWKDARAEREFRDRVRLLLQDMERERFHADAGERTQAENE